MVYGRLNGIGIVVDGIPPGSEVQDADGVVRQIKGVGVAVKVLVVLNAEPLGQAQGLDPLPLGEEQELVGQKRGLPAVERHILQDEPPARTEGTLRQSHTAHRALAAGRFLTAPQPLGIRHGAGIQSQPPACIGGKHLRAGHLSGHGQGAGGLVGHAGEDAYRRLLQRCLLLKGVAVYDQLSLPLGLQPEGGQAAMAAGAGGQVEVVRPGFLPR